MNEDELRRTLADVAPELPAPVDRLGEVRARVRRGGRRTVLVGSTAAAVAVALAIGVPWLAAGGLAGGAGGAGGAAGAGGVLAEPPESAAPPAAGPSSPAPAGPVPTADDGCPTTTAGWPTGRPDAPGTFVPAGARAITLCETVAEGRRDVPPGVPRVLVQDVGTMVTALNELPDQARFLAWLGEQERKAGRPAPTADNLGCRAVGYPYAYSFLLRYRDRAPVLVHLDQNCGTAITGGRTRYLQPDPIDRFLGLYRAQLEALTDPATVSTPKCAPAIRTDPVQIELRDGAARIRGSRDPLLPSPLVMASFCRYEGGRLARFTASRDDLAGLRTAVNAQFPQGPDADPAVAECAGPDRPLPDAVDVLLVADATGALTELWLYRGSCQAALRTGFAGLVPRPDLLAAVDARLGHP